MARTVVADPPALVSARLPSRASTRSSSPARPEPGPRIGAPDPVVGDLDDEVVAVQVDVHRRPAGAGVLDDVRQGLGDDEVGGDLDRGGKPSGAVEAMSTSTAVADVGDQ